MRVLQLNSVFGQGSTGRIVKDLSGYITKQGDDSFVIFGRKSGQSNEINVFDLSNKTEMISHVLLTRVFDKHGFGSIQQTKRLIKQIDLLKPHIIHIHNIHGYYLNMPIFLNYLMAKSIPIIWTLHDCWLFTGHCSYFSLVQCDKWKTGCYNCPAKTQYPASYLFDSSKSNYFFKKNIFSQFEKIHFVTPSVWLKNQVKKSILSSHPVEVISNGVDLNVFKPTNTDYFSRFNFYGKYIILGVSNVWEKRKGLDVFIELSKRLDDTYQIFLVGLSKKQLSHLPKNIAGIERTTNIEELVHIYSSSNLLVNASIEETFGLVTVEALACGIPAVVFDSTALPEIINDSNGHIVAKGDIDSLLEAIYSTKKNTKSKEECIKSIKKFNIDDMHQKYYNLYIRCLSARGQIDEN